MLIKEILLFMDKDLKNKTLGQAEQLITELGQKKYAAKYIFNFIHARNAVSLSQITPISKSLRAGLSDNGYYISQIKTVKTFTDPDKTIKYLFELQDGCRIESVLLSDGQRKTLCVSTQVGCAMGCAFCATAKLKIKRSLTAAEIADQVYAVQKSKAKITNVVFMGMGEPLENYDSTIRAVEILNCAEGKNFGIRSLTISTCGIVPGIVKLADEKIRPRLAVSLNACTDELRNRLMPVNKKYPLTKLFRAINSYQLKTRLRVTFEYILIKGLNDTDQHAAKLARKLSAFNCNINLIEYNPHPSCKLSPAEPDAIKRFADILTRAGFKTAIRLKKGQQINAACGQLGADYLKPNHSIPKSPPND